MHHGRRRRPDGPPAPVVASRARRACLRRPLPRAPRQSRSAGHDTLLRQLRRLLARPVAARRAEGGDVGGLRRARALRHCHGRMAHPRADGLPRALMVLRSQWRRARRAFLLVLLVVLVVVVVVVQRDPFLHRWHAHAVLPEQRPRARASGRLFARLCRLHEDALALRRRVQPARDGGAAGGLPRRSLPRGHPLDRLSRHAHAASRCHAAPPAPCRALRPHPSGADRAPAQLGAHARCAPAKPARCIHTLAPLASLAFPRCPFASLASPRFPRSPRPSSLPLRPPLAAPRCTSRPPSPLFHTLSFVCLLAAPRCLPGA